MSFNCICPNCKNILEYQDLIELEDTSINHDYTIIKTELFNCPFCEHDYHIITTYKAIEQKIKKLIEC